MGCDSRDDLCCKQQRVVAAGKAHSEPAWAAGGEAAAKLLWLTAGVGSEQRQYGMRGRGSLLAASWGPVLRALQAVRQGWSRSLGQSFQCVSPACESAS